MSAIDNKHLLDILAINVQSGVSKKTGNPYTIYKAQCVLTGPDGVVTIGELNLPKSMLETPPGKYLAEFVLGVSMDRMVVPQITALHPVRPQTGVTPKAAAEIK